VYKEKSLLIVQAHAGTIWRGQQSRQLHLLW
jgi:hypothetical protein